MTLRAYLRSASSPLHGELDQMVGGIDPFSSHESYRLYLQSMDALYARFESSLDRASTLASLGVNCAAIRSCIAKDLSSTQDEGHVAEKVAAAEPGVAWSDAGCWGVGYTLEGSAMGASFMVRSVKANLPQPCTTAFLDHLATDAKLRWPAYCKALDQSDCSESEALEGARAVFQAAIEIFAKASSEHVAAKN